MRRVVLAIAVLLALAVRPSYAGTHGTTHHTGTVSPSEFRATVLGATKYATQRAWGATGALRRQWKADGHTYRKKLYRTTWGRGTWVWGIYRETHTGRWRLIDRSWCLARDIARTFSTATYDCYDTPPT